MRIILISTPIGFLGSGKGGGVELTLNSLVSGLLSLGHSVEVIAPKNSCGTPKNTIPPNPKSSPSQPIVLIKFPKIALAKIATKSG